MKLFTCVCSYVLLGVISAFSSALPARDMHCVKMYGGTGSDQVFLNRVVPYAGAHLGGVHVDTSTTPNRIYVFDAANNRILGFSQFKPATLPDGSFPGADIVIGQPALWDSGAANHDNTRFLPPSRDTLALLPFPYVASTMEAPRSGMMATDKDGNFYVVDLCNNRVLKYIDPFANDSRADEVWGQPDFTSRDRGLSASRLRTDWDYGGLSGTFSAGVDVEDDGTLWVADSGNNRVLRFPQGAKTADIVLGQNSFTTAQYGDALNRLNRPTGVRRHPVSGELFVLDGEGSNARMLVFTPPFSIGMSASREFAKRNGAAATGLSWARGFAFDPHDPEVVWIMDGDHCRIIAFNSHTGARVDVVGQPTVNDTDKWTGRYVRPDGSEGLFRQPDGDLGFDSDGNMYFASHYGVSPVVRIPFPLQRNTQGRVISDGEMLMRGMNHISGRTFNDFYGMSVWEDQVIVSDRNRLLVWTNSVAKPMFAHADFVIGQNSFSGNDSGPIIRPHSHTTGSNFVFVINNWNWWINIYEAPVTGSGVDYSPLKILSSSNVRWDDTGESVTFQANGVAYDEENDCLWVSDYYRNRVLRIRNPLGDARVDMVLGQLTKSGSSRNYGRGLYNPDAHSFAAPWTLTLDNYGNLYVVDSGFEGRVDNSGNMRVTRFDAADLQPNPTNIFPLPAATGVFGKPDMTRSRTYYEAHRPHIPTAVAFDKDNQMYLSVCSYGNPQGERIFFYPTPHIGLAPEPTEVVDAVVGQAAHLSMLGDQLVIQDHTWNRVLFYAPSATAPSVDITTPVSTVYGDSVTNVTGIAGANSVGMLTWHNDRTGDIGSIPVADTWSIEALALAYGNNLVTVTVTNDVGVVASDTVTFTRTHHPPIVHITNEVTILPFDTTTFTLAGTNSHSVVGDMWWQNLSTTDVSGVIAATLEWQIEDIPVRFDENIIVVSVTNASGRMASDAVTVTVIPEPGGVALGLVFLGMYVRRRMNL